MKKQALGQYYTIENPFNSTAFKKWFNEIPNKTSTILEPFAGANNIPALILESGITNEWKCFDIEPSSNNKSTYEIVQQDTIENFPVGYSIVITNPPYLAKNSATRKGIEFKTNYSDLYQFCIEIMLKNAEYVCAIIPESFLTQGLFFNRLKYFMTINYKMFTDTDCPVGLAMFVPDEQKDFEMYCGNDLIGNFYEIKNKYALNDSKIKNKINWKFNDPFGEIALFGVDNISEASIYFDFGDTVPSTDIKHSSRAITRISGAPADLDFDTFINKCNDFLKEYRYNTQDLFMTSFKGLRKDSKYRRRLDFTTARKILNIVYEDFIK